MTCEVLQNPYFVMLLYMYIIHIGKTHFKLQDCKNRPSFFIFFSRGGGGGAGMRKEVGEKKWKSENA